MQVSSARKDPAHSGTAASSHVQVSCAPKAASQSEVQTLVQSLVEAHAGPRPVTSILLCTLAFLVIVVCWMLAALAVHSSVAIGHEETMNSYDEYFKAAAINFIWNKDLAISPGVRIAFERDLMNLLLDTAYNNPSLLAIVDPVLSRRVMKRLGAPLVPSLYEATELEFNFTVLEKLLNNTVRQGKSIKGLVVRVSQIERQLEFDRTFPFLQGQLVIDNATWVNSNQTPISLAKSVESQLEIQFDTSGPFAVAIAPKGVIIEEHYIPGKDLNEYPSWRKAGSLPTIGWPVAVQAQMIFGRVYLIEIRDTAGEIRYWAMRNGTSSVNDWRKRQNASTMIDLPDDEARFLEGIVQSNLPLLIYFSELIADAFGAPFLSAWWLVAGELGPRLHNLRYFWVNSLDGMDQQSWGSRIVTDFREGLLMRMHEYERTHFVSRTQSMAAVGCKLNDSTDLSSLWCGSQPHSDSIGPVTCSHKMVTMI